MKYKRTFIIMTEFKVVSIWKPVKPEGEDGFIGIIWTCKITELNDRHWPRGLIRPWLVLLLLHLLWEIDVLLKLCISHLFWK